MMSQPRNVNLPQKESEFRIARPEDLKELLRLYKQLQPKEDPSESDPNLREAWNEIINNPRIHCFVMAAGPNLRATCTLAIIPNLTRRARPFGVLQNVVTDEESRGKGIGGNLIKRTLEFAWQENCYQVMVQTGRPETVPFYCANGFKSNSKIGLVAKPEWQS